MARKPQTEWERFISDARRRKLEAKEYNKLAAQEKKILATRRFGKEAMTIEQRRQELLPCTCGVTFKDGSHAHDCASNFRDDVAEFVQAAIAAELRAADCVPLQASRWPGWSNDKLEGWNYAIAKAREFILARISPDAYLALYKMLTEARNEMLRSVTASIREYPNGACDIEVGKALDGMLTEVQLEEAEWWKFNVVLYVLSHDRIVVERIAQLEAGVKEKT